MATAAVSIEKRRDWRLIIWRIVAGLGALFFLVVLPGLLALLEPWVLIATDRPGYTAEIHRFHEAHWAVINAILYGGCLLGLLRKPREQPLLLQFFVIAMLIWTSAYALVQPIDPMPFVILAIVIAAYPAPRALLSFSHEGAPSIPLLVLGALAGVLLLPEAWQLVQIQLAGPIGEHAAEYHWILTAILECMLVAGGLLAATRRPGWKTLGLLVGIAFVYLGAASISLPYYAGTWGILGGALATIGGWAFIGTSVWAIRRSSQTA
jgi:hypothetical protein